jgi:TPR repeat protein
MKRLIGLIVLALFLHRPALAAHDGTALERPHRGVVLMAIQADPDKTFDTDLLPAEQGLQNLASALDLLLDRSPFSAAKLEILKKSGKVYLIYLPDDLAKGPSGEESLAIFRPDFLRDPNPQGREKIFLVIVGRHAIKWPAEELAAVLAHELVGHGLQHQRGRLSKIRGLDLECEALLYEEIANQNLGLDKLSRDSIQFRQMLEDYFCTDFKTFMRAQQPDSLALWDVLNPDVPKLLTVFEAYLAYSARAGVTGESLAAAQQQLKERRQRALENASPDELIRVALQLRDGALGVQQDLAEARRYFGIAAAQGHAEAQFQLARLYERGQGVPRDLTQAVEWYAKAAAQDHTVAQYNVGVMYNNGQGVARDDETAAAWYRKAAQKGYPDAQNNLGWLYEKGQGVLQDYTAAAKWYAKAAEQGTANANAQFNLARLYAKGQGVPQDYATAAAWYRLAAARGQAAAQFRLGWLYTKGAGVEKDTKQAVAWFRKAAKAGFAAAQNRLGWLRLKGKGVKKDYAKAARWLEAAAKQGYIPAYYNLATINQRGLGRARDHDVAAKLYAKAADKGHIRSQYRLGWYLYRGIGVAKDLNRAASWIGKAAAAGHVKSQHSLG